MTLNVAPGFAEHWLVPRLGRFVAAHPGLAIYLNAPRHYGDLGDGEDDIYISFMTSEDAPKTALKLLDVAFFPVAAPALTGGQVARAPETLTGYPLLHLDGFQDWTTWFQQAGIRPGAIGGMVFPDIHLLAAAAKQGLGIALGDDLTSRSALEEGSLIRIHTTSSPAPRAYWLLDGQGPRSAATKAFEEWIVAELTPNASPEDRQAHPGHE